MSISQCEDYIQDLPATDAEKDRLLEYCLMAVFKEELANRCRTVCTDEWVNCRAMINGRLVDIRSKTNARLAA